MRISCWPCLIRAPTCTHSTYTSPRLTGGVHPSLHIIYGTYPFSIIIPSRSSLQSAFLSTTSTSSPLHLHQAPSTSPHLYQYPPFSSSDAYLLFRLCNSMARTSNTLDTSNLHNARQGMPYLQDAVHRARTFTHPQSRRSSLHGSPTALRLSWVFRSNIPARRGSPLPDVQKRNFFGMSEIISVLANVRPPSFPLPLYVITHRSINVQQFPPFVFLFSTSSYR